MSLVTLQDAAFDYGREKILRGVRVSLHAGEKVALGRIRIRLLRQETTLDVGEGPAPGLHDAVAAAAFAREQEIERQLARLAERLQRAAGEDDQAVLIQEQGRLQDEYERRDGYTVRARLEAALRGVGLQPETWDTPVDRLSGGERRRAALVTVLLAGADLLLLDEPTNHLDLASREWLESFLGQAPAAAVIVSHDRHFLDRLTTRTLHLDRGRLVSYSGNYTFFDQQRRLRYEQDLAAWERQQVRFRQTEEYIRRNIEGQKTKQAQSRRKQMEKEEKLERPAAEPGLIRFRLQPVRPSGGTVLQVHGLSKAYDDRALLRGFDFHVSRGERVGIVGPNGCGKSTLLKLLAGRENPDAGRVVVGHNVDLGYYDQELASVSDRNTALQEMAAVDPTATVGELRSFLAAFGFDEDRFDRPVSDLSGGERGRLALMRLIKEGHNTLLLDEPTNHLDVRSRESLEAALVEFPGTLVVVSHDRRFLDKLIERLIVFGADGADGAPRLVLGNWAEWVRRRNTEQAAPSAPATAARAADGAAEASAEETAGGRVPLSKNEQSRRRQWIAAVEEQIVALENEKEEAMAAMSAAGTAPEGLVDLGRRCVEIDAELAECLDRWERWNLEIDEGIVDRGVAHD